MSSIQNEDPLLFPEKDVYKASPIDELKCRWFQNFLTNFRNTPFCKLLAKTSSLRGMHILRISKISLDVNLASSIAMPNAYCSMQNADPGKDGNGSE